MQQRLKSWESPRRQGRNDKGKGGSARARQLKKQTQALRRKLKEQDNSKNNQSKKRGNSLFPLFFRLSQFPITPFPVPCATFSLMAFSSSFMQAKLRPN